MKKSFIFMLLAVSFGCIFLGIIIVNKIFIFVLKNPNEIFLRETPIILTFCIIGWSISMFFMMIYTDLEKHLKGED